MIAHNLRLLAYGALVYALLIFSAAAFADTYPPSQVWGVASSLRAPTHAGACDIYRASQNRPLDPCGPDLPAAWPGHNKYDGFCKYLGNNGYCQTVATYGVASCPYGGTYNSQSGLCENAPPCPSGQSRDTSGQCQPDPEKCPAAGTPISSGQYMMANPAQLFCSGGCNAVFIGTFPTGIDQEGNVYGTGSIEHMGGGNVGECTGTDLPPTGSAPPPVEPPPEGCGTGNTVTIGDKTYCMPGSGGDGSDDGGDNPGDGGDDGGDNPGDGGDDGGDNPGDGGDNGGDNGSGDGGDNGSGDDEGDDEKDDRNASGGCESFSCSGDAIDCSIAQAAWKAACHPDKRKLTDAPDCKSAPQCEGDAIDCAIAKSQWQTYCQWEWAEKENEFSQAYNEAKSKMDNPEKFVTEKGDSVFQLQNHVSGGSACPAAIEIPLFGKSITAPTDWICGYLGLIAVVLKVLAWLFVGRMVLGAF